MRKSTRRIATAATVGVLLSACATWQLAFRVPAIDLQPLPQNLISLAAAEGQRMAASAASADHRLLTTAFEAQRRPAFCGVASAVIVLNALRPGRNLTQTAFFAALPMELRVTFGGMTLDELGHLLRQHRAEVEVVHASDSSLEAFRLKARENLSRAGDYMLVNYQRSVLGQGNGGHISPLAAYSAETDRFLILDVAAYRYPPVWVSTADLWNAINTVDRTSGRTRGFVVIREGAPPV
jgi:hypothetical protein